MDEIIVINYGMGNLLSISNILNRLNVPVMISDDPIIIRNAKKLILPGIGSFDAAVENLERYCIWDSLDFAVMKNKVPILGICLGMHLMTQQSEEGIKKGFGWINATTKKLCLNKFYKVPNLGWRNISPIKNQSFFSLQKEELRFYFAHSYYVECSNKRDVMATIRYGNEFTCAFQNENILGVQFHPEKSHVYGMHFIKHFVENF